MMTIHISLRCCSQVDRICRKSIVLFLACLTWCLSLSGQGSAPPVMHLSFDGPDRHLNKPAVLPADAIYTVDLLRHQFADGVSGQALDLSQDAILRRPWIPDSAAIGQIDWAQSMSVQVWVKTQVDAPQGTVIMGNQRDDQPSDAGWQISTQPNGAWAVLLSDGEKHYAYRPTRRQAINDGDWHQITVTIQRPKNEARMYFDGDLVAIYNLENLGSLASPLRTMIGGSDEYFEWGSEGQWKAFNGYLDEVKLWDRVLSADEVRTDYRQFFPVENTSLQSPEQVKVLAWNIWHGGRRYGEYVGVQRTIEVIKRSQADIICMIETYGSGPTIADALGYYFYLISSNLSILSKYPLEQTIKAFKPFNFGGVIISLGEGQRLAVMDTWLDYRPDYLKAVTEGESSVEQLVVEENKTRGSEIDQILTEIQPWLDASDLQGIIMGGDFNSGSHLDWNDRARPIHHDYVVPWPVSRSMTAAGFRDSFRELYVDPLTDPGFTWTPRAATSSDRYGQRDRIDYIYYQGDALMPIHSRVVDYHPIMFPSDHAGVVTVFQIEP